METQRPERIAGESVITVEELSDETLLRLVAERDDEALALLYDRHGRAAYNLALRVVNEATQAEDVVQEAFLAVWRRAATYQPERASGRTWLLTIVRNRAIDVLRARDARPRTVSDENLSIAGDDDPARMAVTGLVRAEVRAAVATLPAAQREAVELAFFHGLSYPEVAHRLGLPLGTVKSRLRLAFGRLRGTLDPAYAL